MNTSKTHHIQTTIHGKYIVQEAQNKIPQPLLVGFHGYGENAEQHMHMLQQIPVIQNWFCCAIQALHPFYNAKGQIGFTWMTSLDRELRIQENINYVNAVVAEIKKSYSINDTIVFHGFSQGTAMACRTALLGDFRASGVILLGGDIPPEFENLGKIQRVLIARGNTDNFYSLKKWKNDVSRIKQSSLKSYFCTFEGGHGGHEEYFQAAGEFLNEI